jgi:hypothetical protein
LSRDDSFGLPQDLVAQPSPFELAGLIHGEVLRLVPHSGEQPALEGTGHASCGMTLERSTLGPRQATILCGFGLPQATA